MNRPRESRGSQPSISLKHGRLAHVRSQFSLFRRSPTHKNLPPATFCTSERVFAVLFARRKKYQSVPLPGTFEVLRTSNQRTKLQIRTNKIKSFRRPWRHFPVATATLLPLRGFSTALGGTFCCCRNIFRLAAVSLPGQHTPCAKAQRGFANLA